MQNIDIVLGSLSIVKLDALMKAREILEIGGTVFSISVPSLQNAQPSGLDEICNGAITRAWGAKNWRPLSHGLGIESGIIHAKQLTLEIAAIALVCPDGRQIVTTSNGLVLPEQCVFIAHDRGFKTTTVGSVIAEKFGGKIDDPHSTLTNDTLSRKLTLAIAIMTVLKQILRSEHAQK